LASHGTTGAFAVLFIGMRRRLVLDAASAGGPASGAGMMPTRGSGIGGSLSASLLKMTTDLEMKADHRLTRHLVARRHVRRNNTFPPCTLSAERASFAIPPRDTGTPPVLCKAVGRSRSEALDAG
jgi:hypothetical protein